MSFHTVGFVFNSAVGPPFPAGLPTSLPALPDSFFSLAAPSPTGATTRFLLPVEMKLVMAFAISPTLLDARITAPSLQRVALPLIRPIENGSVPPNDPNVSSGHIAENVIPPGEGVGVDATVSASNEPSVFSFLWFAHKELRPVPHGDAFWVSYFIDEPDLVESSVPGFQWFPLRIGIDSGQPSGVSPLPSGTYAVIGFEHHGPHAVAARLVFPGSPFRPATVATPGSNTRTFDRFYDGSLGTLGIFRTTSLPSIEVVMSASEDPTSHFGHLRLIRVGSLHSDFQPHQLHRLDEHAPDKPTPAAGTAPEHQGGAPATLPHELTGHKEPGM